MERAIKLIPEAYKDTINPVYEGFILITSSNLNYFLKVPSSNNIKLGAIVKVEGNVIDTFVDICHEWSALEFIT